MKQKFLFYPCILLLGVTLIIASCSKGPAGPAGATGAAGGTGATGATGATGTANVIYSPWLNITYQAFTDTNMVAIIPAPKLTDSITNFGEVKVYVNLGSDSAGGEFVSPLPISEPFFFTDNNNNPITLVINQYFYTDTIQLISNYDASSFAINGYNHFQYRYILIPGGVSTGLPVSKDGTKNPKDAIDWNDYNAVKAYLGLKD